jgi:hypothetical protein
MKCHPERSRPRFLRLAESKDLRMKRKANQRGKRLGGANLLLVLVAALFVVLLLVRLLAFVAGHGAHR